ncbi:hypothetical protein J7T55_013087 [Diaporthe amygdali]|uniref:uncharacterized protein n=1 Tax=Phomopsis amygdali TaxID=1214568 RepID=UPI0022FF0F4E|nr:uncharacterized protein J7T55_013087 [Diaporthe amygdali]KAJ0118831.1 hypothetical protein J7T55_013087 [Diaporthe amygdali]
MDPPTTGHVTTNDGVRLSYTQTGPASGETLLFIPGWRQTAAQWHKQVSHFQGSYRVTTYDYRGHGDSEKPNSGYRVYRFAADLLDLLTQLKLRQVHIVAHSMGCSIIWAFFDIYPAQARDLFASVVLVDQSPCMIADPAWTPEQAKQLSAIFSPSTSFELGKDMRPATAGLIKGMFTAAADAKDVDFALERSNLMSDEAASALLRDHAAKDWRDLLPRLDVPTLVVAAEGSVFPAEGVRWVSEQISGARLVNFEKEEGGSHFMFYENPDKFNGAVEDFLRRA